MAKALKRDQAIVSEDIEAHSVHVYRADAAANPPNVLRCNVMLRASNGETVAHDVAVAALATDADRKGFRAVLAAAVDAAIAAKTETVS